MYFAVEELFVAATENVKLSEHFVKNVMLKQGISP